MVCFYDIVGFLSGGVERLKVVRVRCENIRVVSCVPEGSVLVPLILLLYNIVICDVSREYPCG